MKTSGNTILVTGGGSGIGRALAQAWHAAGNTVIVTGRTLASLEETVAGREGLYAMALDVTDAEAIAGFPADVVTRFPALNVLVNNAGIMRFEDLSGSRDLADAQATVVTNLLGPIRMIDALVDHLAAQADAAIVNVTSGLAFVPLAAAPTYSASKAAMHSYSQSLRAQLGGRVEVIELAPPAVQTGLTPGQETREGYLPLDTYIAQVMALFDQVPTPAEICVPNTLAFRNAERDGHFDHLFAQLNGQADRP
ncbi:SDR family oxidoreductase [Novosphingobium sp. SG720]|uniref:SDR family oxidoreductase n=1 Tax=Novosphingobium sp. SG720 TaxID=2586998 RepID=UPI001445D448|nr:SDR family oxidoreductase [Novosphingobium sp. SG720]NKJ43048.1 putative oxidoreductase [Novosphingobium sp. SG720]